MGSWLSKVNDFALAARNMAEPLTFVLGAGCSITSGAPSTDAVHRVLTQGTIGRSDGQPIRDFLQHIKEPERQRLLAPLFQGITPHLGYRSLAALARHRRVHVLNLNWDTLVEDACAQAGVQHVGFDLRERARWNSLDSLPPSSGLACVHVHGVLGDSCRYSVLETGHFKDDENSFIEREFWDHLTLVVGASLQGDLDLETFLMNGLTTARKNGLWYFGRGWGEDKMTSERLHLLHANPREFCVDPTVDFDRLMLAVCEGATGKRWDDLAATSLATPLPPTEELILVEPPLIRGVLDAPLLALVGEPRLGKTVLAHFLAHCFRLWSPLPVEIKHFDSPDSIVAALGAISPGTASPTIYVLEDPFGPTERFEANPAFFTEASRLFETTPPANVRLIVTSRTGGWHTAIQKAAALAPRFTRLSERGESWYRKSDLERLASDNAALLAMIQQGSLRTPGAIVTRARKHRFSNGAGVALIDNDAVSDALALFNEFLPVGVLCVLARLQDFCSKMFLQDDLLRWAGVTTSEMADAYLYSFEFEGSPRFRLNHPSAREATDRYLAAHRTEVGRHLAAKFYPRHPLVQALGAWDLLEQETSSATPLTHATEPLDRWGAPYFARQPDLARLEHARNSAPDQWAMTELAYEVVRLWEVLPAGKGRSDALGNFLSDRLRFGTYALFEACLYLQGAAHPEIRDAVRGEVWKVVADPETTREAALLVDGWMWRPLPDESMPRWIIAYLDALRPDAPAWALVRFLEGYHPEGFAKLPGAYRERDRKVEWSREQTEFGAWLVQWHFAHQANARVLLSRMRLLDKAFLCRTLHAAPAENNSDALRRLIESLGRFPEFPGWAFHLGCNVGCVQGRLTDDLTDLLRDLLVQSPSLDLGVVTAAATYDSVKPFQSELRAYFAKDENRAALLDVLRQGVRIDETEIVPPRFSFSREPATLLVELDLRWKRLRDRGVAVDQPASVAQEFWTVAQPAIASRRITATETDRWCTDIEAGDLRRLEEYATAARAGTSPLQQILDTYLAAKDTQPLFNL